jgi:hypothetical protein
MSCPHCGRNFSSKRNLEYHLTNKVCLKLSKKCEKCGHIFTSKTMLKYHIENSVCEKKVEKRKITLKKEFIENYKEYTKDELLLELAETKGELKALKENPRNINNIQHQQNNVVIFPSAYGKEDINYICKKLGDILGPLVKYQTFDSIRCLSEKIHTNKQLPEYHNVYTTSEKSSFALISDGERFRNRPKKNVIDQIIEDKRAMLNEYVDSNGEQLGELVLEKYEKYQDKLDSDPIFRRQLELEIGGLLLDMKAIIANDEKTRNLLQKVDEGNFELDS